MVKINKSTVTDKSCSYLPEMQARFRMASVHPVMGGTVLASSAQLVNQREESNKVITGLVEQGWISQPFCAISMACDSCSACKPGRVDVTKFQPSKDQRRKILRNKDTVFKVVTPLASTEHFGLYQRYIRARHPSSSMASKDMNDFRAMILGQSTIAELYLGGELIACSTLKENEDSIVVDYTFFDPDRSKWRGLGGYMDVKIFEYARSTGRQYVYLGAINEQSQTLSHKGKDIGSEYHNGEKWVPYSKRVPV